MPADPLKLIALDPDDLAVISAHVQDARVQPADIVWRQDEKRLVVGMNRLDWEQTLSGGTEPRRLIAALRFDRVLACKSRNIDLDAPDAPWPFSGRNRVLMRGIHHPLLPTSEFPRHRRHRVCF